MSNNKNVVENTQETVNFPVYMLLSKPLTGAVQEKVKWFSVLEKIDSEGYSSVDLPSDSDVLNTFLPKQNLKPQELKGPIDDLQTQALGAALVDLRDNITKAVAGTDIGAEVQSFQENLSLVDRVPVTLKLGDVIFSLYTQNDQPLKAPLARALQQEKQLEIAKTLNKDKFSVPDEAFESVRECLLDEEKWEKMVVYGSFSQLESDKVDKHIPFKTHALSAYKKIMSGLLLAFMPKKDGAVNETHVNKIKQGESADDESGKNG